MTNNIPRRDCVKMLLEYLKSYDENLVTLQASHGVVIVVGSNKSGLAVYGKKSKLFRFYCAHNLEVMLSTDDEEVYEEVELEDFCRELAN